MAKRYSKEWKRNVAKGVRQSKRSMSPETRKKLSEAARKGNLTRTYKKKDLEELKSPHSIRERLFEERGRECERCGWHKKSAFTGIIPVQVSHKDGDRNNNTRDNLEILCPNCHSMTGHFMFYGRSHRGTYGKKGTKRYR